MTRSQRNSVRQAIPIASLQSRRTVNQSHWGFWSVRYAVQNPTSVVSVSVYFVVVFLRQMLMSSVSFGASTLPHLAKAYVGMQPTLSVHWLLS